MKEGYLIEFRPDLFGLKSPQNLGIVLRRETRKKIVYVTILTLKGIREVKKSQLTKRRFNDFVKIPENKKDRTISETLQPKLKELVQKHSSPSSSKKLKGKGKEKASVSVTSDKIIDDVQKLWEWWNKNFSDITSMTTIEILEKYYNDKPNSKQINQLDEILKENIPKGEGYFDLISEKPRKWQPISQEIHRNIGADIQRLRRLRERMIEEEYQEEEDDEGYVHEVLVLIPVELYVLNLTDEEKELLERTKKWMYKIIRDKTISGDDLLANTHMHTIGSFSLTSWLGKLAEDWIGEELLQSASAMTEFLFKTEFLSESEALDILAKRAVKEHPSFSWNVDDRMQELALELKNPEDEPEEIERRVNLQDLLSYTVDPASARDFDQALSLIKNDDGSYMLWVHIADVTHYVERDSLLDRHARQRATSVYVPMRVLPMHPPALSTGLGALQENVPRFAVTVKMHFSKEGEKLSSEIVESVIKVKKNLAYEDVDEALADLNHKDHEYWQNYMDLGKILRKSFNGLEVETQEARLSTTGMESHGLLDMKVEKATPSTSMNEILMIATNETVAEYIRDSGFPGYYRCHAIPDRPNVEKFNDQMVSLGIDYEIELTNWSSSSKEKENESKESGKSSEEADLDDSVSVLDMLKAGGGKMSFGGGGMKSLLKPTSSDDSEESDEKGPSLNGLAQLSEEEAEKMMKPFREVLRKIKSVDNRIERMVMHLSTLGMFGRAYYTRENIGHFGLGSRCYTHFTAPIRRYSDDIVHRILKGILQGKATKEEPIYTKDELDELGDHCSELSAAADKLMYRVTGQGLALLTRRKDWQGEIPAIVTRVQNRGPSVMLRETVDGRIRMRDLSNDEVIVDESESIAFRKLSERVAMRRLIHATDWQDMLNEDDELIEKLIKLGEKIRVTIVSRDYVQGNVNVKPA